MKDCIYINPDNIAKEKFGDWNSQKAVLEAAQYAEKVRDLCLEKGRSLAFETVFSIADKVEFIQRAKKIGYFVRLFFVGTDHPAINAARITKRVMEGGHDVPITKIISRYSKSISNCAIASLVADRTYVYDNSIDGRQPELMFRSKNGEMAKIYCPIHSWADEIVLTLEAHNKLKSTPVPIDPKYSCPNP